ncbi:MAG: 2-oxoglutarate dehydrogenase complex dihydrolipoyllysine-residue succinyltransferase [Gammaproteobacteria bacterium]|nr:2-oxoglutarate dehydrogenase complex dihydrolipoyllysine-residue succinyltransferase [Gammaproteobacteria bacterium]
MDVKAPTFPESISEGELTQWYKEAGDYVERDDVLADLETEKTTLEIPAPASGLLTEIVKQEGELVESEDVLARLDENASKPVEEVNTPVAAEENEPERIEGRSVAPSARKLAEEEGIDINTVVGTGRRGMVTKSDVQQAIQSKSTEQAPTPPRPEVIPEEPVQQGMIDREERRVPMSRMRATIARRLVEVQQTSAMLTTFNEADMAHIKQMRQQYRDDFERRHNGTRLGYMSFFVRACVEALKRFPAVNASIDGDDIVYHGYYDIGVAVSTTRGLVVPIIKNADALGMAQIENTIVEYSEKARENKLTLDELQGGTFTITNGGVFGSLMSTPILNPPQTAILGMHTIQDRPVVQNGEIVIRPMMYLALSYDHRLIDGQEAVQFLVTIKGMLEDPARILLEL